MAKVILEQLLEKKKISKRKFAKMINKDYREVFRSCEEGYDPKLSTLDTWAKALKVKIKDLFKE